MGVAGRAQTGTAEYSRKSDVIYGRRMGLGLTMELLTPAHPVSSVTPDDPPTILIHGDADQAEPLQQSRRLIDRLKAANVEGRLVIREGMRHAWPGWEADSELIAQWFDSHLHPSSPR